MEWPEITVFRLSASRPEMLFATHYELVKKLKYSGKIRFLLIESVMIEKLSEDIVKWAKEVGYDVELINPAQGQGMAVKKALDVISSPYALKWEDDFLPLEDIPLDDCVLLMEQHSHINQICFNKRKTMDRKWASVGGKRFEWIKEQRSFWVNDPLQKKKREIHLVVKEKWWMGSSLWRMSFIKPIFDKADSGILVSNYHNFINDKYIMPLAGYKPGQGDNEEGKVIPTPEQVEKYVGCYIYGKHRRGNMVEHIGRGNSLWMGEQQKKWKKEGFKIVGGGR